MVQEITFRDEYGTISIKLYSWRDMSINIRDSYNSYDALISLTNIKDYLQKLEELSNRIGEINTQSYIRQPWYKGNYIETMRAKKYIEVIKSLDSPRKYKATSLKRMTTKNLMDVYVNAQSRNILLKELRKVGTR